MITIHDLPNLPSIVDGAIAHRRHGPIRHQFRHRAYQWLIDLDQVPRLPWYLRAVASFDARDHLGGTDADASTDIKTNIERFLRDRCIDLGAGGRIVMLANARVLGHVFDPLTVFWCFAADGTLRCVIAEVHNTYGERHAYLLHPGSNGEAGVDKQLYVSPFNDMSGRYEMRFELTPSVVRVSISLLRAASTVFDAVFTGVPTPATTATVLRFAVRMPLMPQKVSVLIRTHGVWLWIRRLPVINRPPHPRQQGV